MLLIIRMIFTGEEILNETIVTFKDKNKHRNVIDITNPFDINDEIIPIYDLPNINYNDDSELNYDTFNNNNNNNYYYNYNDNYKNNLNPYPY